MIGFLTFFNEHRFCGILPVLFLCCGTFGGAFRLYVRCLRLYSCGFRHRRCFAFDRFRTALGRNKDILSGLGEQNCSQTLTYIIIFIKRAIGCRRNAVACENNTCVILTFESHPGIGQLTDALCAEIGKLSVRQSFQLQLFKLQIAVENNLVAALFQRERVDSGFEERYFFNRFRCGYRNGCFLCCRHFGCCFLSNACVVVIKRGCVRSRSRRKKSAELFFYKVHVQSKNHSCAEHQKSKNNQSNGFSPSFCSTFTRVFAA